MVRAALFILLLVSVLSVTLCGAVTCTVGPFGTYATIGAGLLGCNGGVGSYTLLLEAGVTFTETFVVPPTALNVTFMSEDFFNGLVPEVPFLSNITTIIAGSNHVVRNVSTALYFLGLGLDGQSAAQPMFDPWLYNNNVTIDRCFISNWTGNYSLRIEACVRAVSFLGINTRWSNVWGSAVYAEAMEDIRLTNSICDGCGGYHNFSAFYLKPSYVSEGVFIVTNVSHWLLLDAQPQSCVFVGDKNGMVLCNQGVLYCYNAAKTAEFRPNCQQVNTSYIDELDNTTKFITDFPQECRFYEPCQCPDLEFLVNGTQTVLLPIGDLFFYTGLRLNCTVASGATPYIVLTGTTNVTDPTTNVTTPTSNADIFKFITSHAGENGVGVGPSPDDGFSLYPNVYITGQVDQSLINCTCAPGVNQSALSLGLPCDYDVIASEGVTCNNGIVGSCAFDFLLCYAASTEVIAFLQAAGNQADLSTTAGLFCNVNGTLVLVNETGSDLPCAATLSFNATAPWFLTLIENTFACLVEFEANTQIVVFQAGLSAASALSLCGTDPDLIAQGCPTLPIDPGVSQFVVSCSNCSATSVAPSQYLLARVCTPYHCPTTYNVTCKYFYDGNGTVSLTHVLKFTLEVTDGRVWLGNNSWSNGDLVCALPDPDEAEWKNKQCLQQVLRGFACNPANSTISSVAVNETTTFPRNATSDCGADFTCVSSTLATCSCSVIDIGMCLSPYTIGRNAAVFHFDNLGPDLSFVSINFNRGQQLYVGTRLDRTSEAVIFNASAFQTGFSDWQARLRELWRTNYQIQGALHDFMYGLPDPDTNIAAYRFFCDDGCPIPFSTEADFDCIVDASIPADQVDNFYQEVQLAIDDGCENIVVRNYENFYVEDLVINNNVKRIYSLPDQGACVSGIHQVDVNDLDLRGMCFLHPGGENAAPLFTIKQDMDTFFIRNAQLDGGGARRAGIMPMNLKKLINYFSLNHTLLSLWNYATVIMKEVGNVEITHNTFSESYGRSVDVRYSGIARIIENSLINCRGTGDSKGVPLLRITARSILGFGGFILSGGGVTSCSNQSSQAFNNLPCAFYGNKQSRDPIEDEDFDDVCFSLIGGLIDPSFIFDQICYKAKYGMQLRQIQSITSANIPQLIAQNAMVRPNNFVTTGNAKKIYDFVYDLYFTSTGLPIFVPFITTKCDFANCLPPANQLPVCTVNPNFREGYVGALGQTYSLYGQQAKSGLGFGVYTNVSLMLDFCDLTRRNPYTGNVERPAYFTGDQGGRMFRDVFNITKPGVSFYGALLPGEAHVPPECFHRSQVFGDGWLILGDNFTAMNMSFRRDYRAMDVDNHMFSNIPDTQVIYNVNFTNCTFSAGNLVPLSGNQIIRIESGIDEDRYLAQNKPRGGRRPKALVNQPTSLVLIQHCIFEEFAVFDTNLIDPSDHERYNTSLTEWPYTDPIYVQNLNTNPNASTVIITNCTFYGVPHRAIDVRYVTTVNVSGNIFADLGSRAQGNPSGLMIMGSNLWASNLTFDDNLIYQTQPVLSDKTNSAINPGNYAQVWIAGYKDGSIVCIKNNTISGGAIGLRVSGMNKTTTLVSCINATEVPGFLDDGLDYIRRIWWLNNNITGYVQCIVYGIPSDDFFDTWEHCCNGCFPFPFGGCNVSLTNPKYAPPNPLFNKILFNDLDLAIRNCTDSTQQVRVLLNTPPQPYVLASPIDFPAGHPALNATGNVTVRVFADETATIANPVVIAGCNHQLLRGKISFDGFVFNHLCLTPACTWNFTAPDVAPVPRKLSLYTNTFVGNNFPTGAACGIVEDGWVVGDSAPGGALGQPFYKFIFNSQIRAVGRGNTFGGYTGERVVDLIGRNCSTSVRVWFNVWNGCTGACLVVNQTGGATVDFNTVLNVVGTSTVENAGIHVSVCQPSAHVPYELDFQWNVVDEDTALGSYAPVVFPNNGGYITGFWLDPVPNNFMKTTIQHNSGHSRGVCIRVDDKFVTFSFTDPQSQARHIALQDKNLYCKGDHYWVRLLNGPAFDPTVDSDLILWRAYFCNDGCPKISDIQLAILVAIPAVLFALLIAGGLFYMLTRGVGTALYYSGVVGEYIYRNSMRWESIGVIQKLKRRNRENLSGQQ